MKSYKINYTELQSCIEELRALEAPFPEMTVADLGESAGVGATENAVGYAIEQAGKAQEQLAALIRNTAAFLDTLMQKNKQEDLKNSSAVRGN